MAHIEFEGLEDVLQSVEDIADLGKLKTAMGKACALVERSAKQKAPKGSGELRRSITSEVVIKGGDITGKVFTPLSYAPYVEYGTGIHAEKNGSSGWWVYVDDENSDGQQRPVKHYTEKEAKRICAILRSRGLKAYATDGHEPQPFLGPAFNENREKIIEILAKGLNKK